MSTFNVSTENLPDDSHRENNSRTDKVVEPKYIAAAAAANEYLNEQEIRDPNAITVEISNDIPLVILYGAGHSGKTMALVRLSRYLKNHDYSVTPVRDFRPTHSKHYRECCDDFTNNIFSSVTPPSTNRLNFMLLNISKDGNHICQLLEAPGEHFFDKSNPALPYPTYIHTIANNKLPKIWVFMLEIGWESQIIRDNYADKITSLFGRIRRSDNIILLCNKSDLSPDYIYNDKPDTNKYYKDIKRLYPSIFSRLEGRGFLGKLFGSDSRNFDFVVFSAGSFTNRADGEKAFIAGSDYYPGALWKAIKNGVKGSWW